MLGTPSLSGRGMWRDRLQVLLEGTMLRLKGNPFPYSGLGVKDLVFYWGYLGIMENKMETIILGLYRIRV